MTFQEEGNLEDSKALFEDAKRALNILAHGLQPLGPSPRPSVGGIFEWKLKTPPLMIATITNEV